MSDLPKFPEGITDLYAKHAGHVIAYLQIVGATREDAEDAVSDGFLAMALHWPEIKDGNPLAYAYRSARNSWFSTLKSGQRQDRIRGRIRDLRPKESDRNRQAAARLDLEGAVRKLRPRQREVIVLQYMCGLSVEEMAAVLGISTSAVRVYAFEGRQRLAKLLGDEYFDGEEL